MTTKYDELRQRWTHEDDAAAAKEGWGLFECSDITHAPFELERIDCPEDGDAELPDDPAAWRLVLGLDSPLHRRAIAFLEAEAPEELAYIRGWLAEHPAD